MSGSASFSQHNNDSDDSTTLWDDEFASGTQGEFEAVNNKLQEYENDDDKEVLSSLMPAWKLVAVQRLTSRFGAVNGVDKVMQRSDGTPKATGHRIL